MEWGKLYANLPDDPRVQAAEDSAGAGWLLVESMCYCTSAETGGFIPNTQVERFGGGAKKKQKIAALVREQLWLTVEGGYTLNPDIWTEERNLNDAAEKKKKADRERQRANRAGKRDHEADNDANMSRDSRATSRATGSGDSRALDQRREEKNRSTADLVSHLQVADAPAIDDDGLTQVSAALARKAERIVTPDEARRAASVILQRAERSGKPARHPVPYVVQAIDDEPDVYTLLLGDPPPLAGLLADDADVPDWCGQCDQRTRLIDPDADLPERCPSCNPRSKARPA